MWGWVQQHPEGNWEKDRNVWKGLPGILKNLLHYFVRFWPEFFLKDDLEEVEKYMELLKKLANEGYLKKPREELLECDEMWLDLPVCCSL